MFLELADNNTIEKIFIPGINGGANFVVNPSFFDKLNDYEYSNSISEILQFNPQIDLLQLISERDSRRKKLGLRPTNYSPELSSKFGTWLSVTGKKIEKFFQSDSTNQPVTATLPDGQTVVIQTPVKQDSPFMNVLKGITGAFGLYNPPTPNQPQQQNSLSQYLPIILIAGGGLLAYKLISKK